MGCEDGDAGVFEVDWSWRLADDGDLRFAETAPGLGDLIFDNAADLGLETCSLDGALLPFVALV